MLLGACGCNCSECGAYEVSCAGCYAIEGKPSWIGEVGREVCDYYDCSVNSKKLSHCGECKMIPCEKFFANKIPGMTEEEYNDLIDTRVVKLKNYKK